MVIFGYFCFDCFSFFASMFTMSWCAAVGVISWNWRGFFWTVLLRDVMPDLWLLYALGDGYLVYNFCIVLSIQYLKQCFQHGYYNGSNNYYYDIGMVELVQDAEINEYVLPVTISTPKQDSFNSHDICYISGWGNIIGLYNMEILLGVKECLFLLTCFLKIA